MTKTDAQPVRLATLDWLKILAGVVLYSILAVVYLNDKFGGVRHDQAKTDERVTVLETLRTADQLSADKTARSNEQSLQEIKQQNARLIDNTQGLRERLGVIESQVAKRRESPPCP